jgi:hypothetical protein
MLANLTPLLPARSAGGVFSESSLFAPAEAMAPLADHQQQKQSRRDDIIIAGSGQTNPNPERVTL